MKKVNVNLNIISCKFHLEYLVTNSYNEIKKEGKTDSIRDKNPKTSADKNKNSNPAIPDDLFNITIHFL